MTFFRRSTKNDENLLPDFIIKIFINYGTTVAGAQLAESLLLTPEIRGLKPNIGNKAFRLFLSGLCN